MGEAITRRGLGTKGNTVAVLTNHSSFRTTQSGLPLNMDVSTTTIVPVAKFLVENQNLKDPILADWEKAKRTLENLRIKVRPSNREFKITGLTDKTCRDQTFTLKQRNEDEQVVSETQVTVYDYFVKHLEIDLQYSENLPCINVGKPKRPSYFPMELCSLLSLQSYTKGMSALSNGLRNNNYGAEPMLGSCGVSINNSFTQVEGRVLPAPRLKGYNEEDLGAKNGRWNFYNKRFAGLEKSKVHIVFVGGSTRIPKVKEMLRDYFGDRWLINSGNPDETLAYGAAYEGWNSRREGIDELQDIPFGTYPSFFMRAGLSLGIETVGGIMTKVIHRKTPTPIKRSHVFSTFQDNQTTLSIKVYQGERALTRDCLELGSFELSGIPPAPRGVP